MQNITPQQIQKSYDSSLDSVRLIERLVTGAKTDKTKANVLRNVDHLKLMVAKDYWTTQSLAPLNNAITIGDTWVAIP